MQKAKETFFIVGVNLDLEVKAIDHKAALSIAKIKAKEIGNFLNNVENLDKGFGVYGARASKNWAYADPEKEDGYWEK